MILRIENIAKIGYGEIPISGLTVIAGPNDSGKSTVCKCLESLYSLSNKQEEIIKKSTEDNLRNILRNCLGIYFTPSKSNTRIDNNDEMQFESYHYPILLDYLLATIKESIKHGDTPTESEFYENINIALDRFNKDYLPESSDFSVSIYRNKDSGLYEKIVKEFKEITEHYEEIRNSLLKESLNNVLIANFHGQINCLFSEDAGSIKLSQKEEFINARIKNNIISELSCSNKMFFDKPALYIKDLSNYKEQLISVYKNFTIKGEPRKDAPSAQRELFKIFPYSFPRENNSSQFEKYRFDLLDHSKNYTYFHNQNKHFDLNTLSLSPGLYSFAVLSYLLKSGELSKKGILILDEPEVHLNPEWQIKIAEILLLIHKELNLPIVVNTHSPYLLYAIETYAGKMNLSEKVSYCMLSQKPDGRSIITNTKTTLDNIYEMLSAPFQYIEDLKYGDNDE